MWNFSLFVALLTFFVFIILIILTLFKLYLDTCMAQYFVANVHQ